MGSLNTLPGDAHYPHLLFLSLASMHEETVQETDYLLFYICENDYSVLCLFKY